MGKISIIYFHLILFVLLILILAPRSFTRKIRHALVKLNMSMWKKGSLYHAFIDAFLYQKGNSHS